MFYDWKILEKKKNGQYICIDEPKHCSPTYNLGKICLVVSCYHLIYKYFVSMSCLKIQSLNDLKSSNALLTVFILQVMF